MNNFFTVFVNLWDLLLLALLLFTALVYCIYELVSRIGKLIRGECVTHKKGDLLDVASVGGGAKWRCAKCDKSFWTK